MYAFTKNTFLYLLKIINPERSLFETVKRTTHASNLIISILTILMYNRYLYLKYKFLNKNRSDRDKSNPSDKSKK